MWWSALSRAAQQRSCSLWTPLAWHWRQRFDKKLDLSSRSASTDVGAIIGNNESIQRKLAVDPTRPRVRKRKPTTPSNRATALIDFSVLYRGPPVKRLTGGLRRSTGGRNNQGRTTVWHRGGGHRRLYRILDLHRRQYAGLPGCVERVEYDPNRSGLIALLRYTLPEKEASSDTTTTTSSSSTTVFSDLYRNLANALQGATTPLPTSPSPEPRLVYLPYEVAKSGAGTSVSETGTSAPATITANSSTNASTALPSSDAPVEPSRRPEPTVHMETIRSNVRVLKRRSESSPKTHLSYILCPQGIRIGDLLLSRTDGPVEPKPGNACPLRYLPIGTTVHNIEMRPRSGGQLCRAAGTSAQLLEKDEKRKRALLRLQSREVRYIHLDCMATVGAVSNPEHRNQSIGKAGRSRWLGRRPVTRGVAMNPVDHPHGGGEGKTSGGRPSVTPWGKPTKGYRTVRKPRGANFIVRRRFKE